MTDVATTIVADQYGVGTPAIVDILTMASKIEFFRRQDFVSDDVRVLVDEIERRLLLTDVGKQWANVRYVLGGWPEYSALREETRHWSEGFIRRFRKIDDEALTAPGLVDRVGPPLWPARKLLEVVEPIVAQADRVFATVDGDRNHPGWDFACAIDSSVHEAIRWAFLRHERPNPYEPAVELAVHGFTIVGLRNDELIVFALADTSKAIEL